MKNVSNVDQDYKLWVLLDQANTTILNAREDELRQYHVSAMQAAVLFIIKAIGKEVTPAEIARWLLRKPHTVSGLLTRMEKAGLVKKTKDFAKKNMIRVTLTAKGEKAHNQSLKRESISQIMSCLSPEERRQLELYLKKLRDEALKEPRVKRKRLPFP